MNIKNNSALFFLILICIFLGFQVQAKSKVQTKKISSMIINPTDEAEIEILDASTDLGMETSAEATEKIATVDTSSTGASESDQSSVLTAPTTDNSLSVLNKKIKFSKRFQLDLNSGYLPDEIIVNNNYSLVRLSYYTNEEYSFGLGMRARYGGKTPYSQQFYLGGTQLDFSRAPEPKEAYFVTYGYNFYYGKISLSKNIAIPASTKLEFDVGMQSFNSTSGTDSKLPLLQAGVNQSFFMGKHLALGLSVGLSVAQIIDPTSVNVNLSQPIPSNQSFDSKVQFNQYLSLNLNVLM